jgi:hypothetical protein
MTAYNRAMARKNVERDRRIQRLGERERKEEKISLK